MLAASKPGFFNIRVTIACSCNTELEADRRALSSDIYSQVRGLRKVDPYSSRSNSRSRKVWIDLAGDFIIITITVEVDCRGPSKSACDGPILYHFRDKARYWLKIVIFYIPPGLWNSLPETVISVDTSSTLSKED